MLIKLYQKLKQKIELLNGSLQAGFYEGANLDGQKIFRHRRFFLHVKILFYETLVNITKFLILVTHDSGTSFNFLIQQAYDQTGQACEVSYRGFQKVQRKVRIFSAAATTVLVVATVITSMLLNMFFGGSQGAFAGTYTWNQTGWVTAEAGSDYAHPESDDTDTKFDAKDAGVDISSGTSATLTQTTGNDADTLTADFDGDTDTGKISVNDALSLTQNSGGDYGDGGDGAWTISTAQNINTQTNGNGGRTCADGIAYNLTGLTAGTATLSATPTAGCLNDGDKVLLLNLQGDGTDVTNVGNYEVLTLSGNVTTTTATFTGNKTKYYGDGASDDTNIGTATTNQRVIVQRIPQYTDVTIQSGGSLTANAWDGTKGGVLTFYASGTVDVQSGGNVTMSEKGYRGHGAAEWTAGETYGRIGAGGGTYLGAGGSAYDSVCNEISFGGGGYGSTGGIVGFGGSVYGDANLTKMFMGSAGGRGGTLTTPNTGGGIAFINASTISVSGGLSNNGRNANGNFAGGAGGAVYLTGNTITVTGTLTATGGTLLEVPGWDDGEECGNADGFYAGAGGVGRIHLKSNSISGTTTPTAATSGVTVTYETAGTYTSPVIDTGHVQTWGAIAFDKTDVSGGSVAVRARSCNDSACSGETALSSCSALTSGNDLSSGTPTNCVTDGDQYIQYSVALTAGTNNATTPSLNDITLNYAYYAAGESTLTSAAFNTDDIYNALNKISWTNSGASTAKFQVRTAASEAGLAAAAWCGPDDATPGSCNSSGYFIVGDGNETIDDINKDKSGDMWMQYKMFLSSADGAHAPTVTDVTLEYNFNEPPAITSFSATQNASTGDVDITYNIEEFEDNQLSDQAMLFYQFSGVTLAVDTTENGTGDITVSSTTNFPSSGQVLIEDELISYSGIGVGNTLTGIARARNFNADGGFLTTGAVHSASAAVFVAGTQFSAGTGIGTVTTTTDAAAKSFTWNTTDETHLADLAFANLTVKVVANDGQAYNRLGTSVPAVSDFALDLEKPTVTSITTDADPSERFKQGGVINLTFNFSENLSSVAGVTATLNSGGTCSLVLGNPANTATCAYTVGATDNANPLSVDLVEGNLVDLFSNTRANPAVPSGADDIDDEGLIVDTTLPLLTEVAPDNSAYINSINSGSDVSYTLSENVQAGSIVFTRTGGDAAADKTCTLKGSALNSGTHYNINLSDTANACETAINLNNNTVYSMTVSVTDLAGNNSATTTKTGVTFDTTAPTLSAVTIASNNAVDTTGAKVGDTVTLSFTAAETLGATPTATISGQDATEASAGGDAYTATYVMQSSDTEGVLPFTINFVDRAGNTGTQVTTKTSGDNVTFDKTAATLQSFTSDSTASTVEDQDSWYPTALTSDVDVRAVFNENITAGSITLNLNTIPTQHEHTINDVAGTDLHDTYTIVQGENATALQVASISSYSVTDWVGNNTTSAPTLGSIANFTDKLIRVDTTPPILESFTTSPVSGFFNAGDDITIIAQYNKTLKDTLPDYDSYIDIKIDADGSTETLRLTTRGGADNDQLRSTYTVAEGDNSANLTITNITSQSVFDFKNRQLTDSGVGAIPADTIQGVLIDTTDPVAAFGNDCTGETCETEAGPVTSDLLKVNVTETNAGDYKYGFSANNICDSNDTYGNDFTSGNAITLNTETNNGKYVCFKVADQSGNTAYLASATNDLDIDVTDPTGTITFDRSAASDHIQLTAQDLNADATNRGITGLEMRIKTLASELTACTFSESDAYVTYAAAVTLADPSSVLKACVQLQDQAGNVSDIISTYTPENPTNLQATDISNLNVSPIFRGVFLSWQIPTVIGEGGIDYFEIKDCDNAAGAASCDPDAVISTVDYAEPVQNYDYRHENLAADTQYCYKVRFKDNHGNFSKYSSTRCVTPGAGLEALTAITMLYNSGDQAGDPIVLTDQKAVIAFTTDQPAKCSIAYGTIAGPANYTEVPVSDPISETDYNIDHAIHLPGLVFSTSYYYQINCEDAGDTSIAADEYSFTTLAEQMTEGEANAGDDATAPNITSVSTTNITGDSATVTWTTQEDANSSVAFGLTTDTYENMAANYIVNSDKENFVTSHSVIMHSLIPATKYFYSVISYDTAGNIGQSSESSFTTKAPSSLSAVKVVSKNLSQAVVTWNTDKDTTSVVEYGLTTAYGDEKENKTKAKEHEITITGLQAKQTYHFRVMGSDADGSLYASSDNTFEPKSPPQIDNLKVADVSERSGKVTFTTDVPTDALITFADVKDITNTGAQGKPELLSKHEVELKSLSSGTTYSLKIRVRDEAGNETEETFPNFTTGKDENAPKLDNIKTDSALAQSDKVQSIISWVTDELATTEVIYKEGRTGQEKNFKAPGGMVTNHVAVITSFAPGKVYYFNAKSEDAAGNAARSGDFALLTPKVKENIVQVIIGNFEDIFSWAKL